MFDLFAHNEKNLGRAGWLLILELGGAVAAGSILSGFGISTEYIFPCVWLFNMLPAWHLSRAALELGKSRWVYGVVSALLPVCAIAVWFRLHSLDSLQLLERSYGHSRDEA